MLSTGNIYMSPGYPDTAPSGDRETTDDISGMNSCSLPSVSTRHSTPFINAIFISGTDMRSSIKILLKFSCSRKIFFKYFSKFLVQEKIFLKFSCNYNFRAFPIQYSCHIFSKINLDPLFNKQGILMKRMFLKKSQKFIFHRIIPQKYTKTLNLSKPVQKWL